MEMSHEALSANSFFDLVVIGSGPAALAVVTRILESRPAALYTEEEHAHLHWLKKTKGSRPLMKVKRTGRGQEKILNGSTPLINSSCDCSGAIRIFAIDRWGGWLANWDRLFKAYEISHLRSPMFFHPAPFDVDALVAYAERNGRTRSGNDSLSSTAAREEKRGRTREKKQVRLSSNEHVDLVEIAGCVGKEVSKHKIKQEKRRKGAWTASLHSQPFGPAVNERNRRDYFTPSTKLFQDFISEDLVRRYGLDNRGKPWQSAKDAIREAEGTERITLVKGEVSDLVYNDDLHVQGWNHTRGFEIKLSCGTLLSAKAVVCAIGPGATPNVPAFVSKGSIQKTSGPGWCHSTKLSSLPPMVLIDKEKKGIATTLVVVGGGLTSAQICDVVIRKGISKVILILRGYMKVKPFDFGLEWVGQYGNLEHMRFWQEEDLNKRREMMFAARNGGSITPRYSKLMKQYQEQGRLTILDNTLIENAEWIEGDAGREDDGSWHLDLKMMKKVKDSVEEMQIQADYMIAATGAATHFSKIPFLSSIIQREQVDQYGGLPVLNEGLQYGNIPLFITGAFSALQVGPGAFNLIGSRAAADRIAIRLQELAIGKGTVDQDDKDRDRGVSESEMKEMTQSSYTHYSFDVLSVEAEA